MRVKDRVRKLIVLSQNNPNPKEAASAMAMAKHLATKYGVSIKELEKEIAPVPDVKKDLAHVERMMNMMGFKAGVAKK